MFAQLVTSEGSAIGILWADARDTDKNPTTYKSYG